MTSEAINNDNLRQYTGYNSLIKDICPGVGSETLTFKMEMHCYIVLITTNILQDINRNYS